LYANCDLRFLDAIVALDEYGIVDDSFDFIPGWVPKDLAELEKKRDQAIIDTIDHLVSRGKPVRRAVAMLAARIGEQATSFEAARKRLETLYACSRKIGAAPKFLEKSCSTTIPTTATRKSAILRTRALLRTQTEKIEDDGGG